MANKETCSELTTKLKFERQSLMAWKRKLALLEDKNEALELAREALGAQDELLNSTGCPIPGSICKSISCLS